MKKNSLLIAFLAACLSSFAQDVKKVASDEIQMLLTKASDSLNYYYVNVEEGKKIGDYLMSQFYKGSYTKINDPETLAKQLTNDLRSVNGDLHLSFNFINPAPENEEVESVSNERYGVSTNYGFEEIRFVEGNIGYLKVSHFSNWDFAAGARQKISEIMPLFSNCDAIIIDLRDNRGGVPYIASYLISYFFGNEPVHLADMYTRFNNFQYGIYTEPLVPGLKYPNVPLYVLVNNRSASAAEEFTFWIKNHKRATIIGQTTAGAGYGAMNHQLNNRFSISISSEEELNPITRKGFEGIGVIPDIIINDTEAYNTALELAKKNIEQNTIANASELEVLQNLLRMKEASFSEILVFEQVIKLSKLGQLSYQEIITLSENYLNEPKKKAAILRANTVLYAYTPAPFDAYAEALTEDGKYQLALQYYDKSVLLATLKKNPNLNQFKENRENFLKQYGNKLNEK